MFPHQNLVHASPHPHTRYMPRPSLLDFIVRVQYIDCFTDLLFAARHAVNHHAGLSHVYGQSQAINTQWGQLTVTLVHCSKHVCSALRNDLARWI
jgi:hypothetical protein